MEGKVYYGAVDSNNQEKMLDLQKLLKSPEKLSLETLRRLNRDRKARKSALSARKSRQIMLENASQKYMDILSLTKFHKNRCYSTMKCLIRNVETGQECNNNEINKNCLDSLA